MIDVEHCVNRDFVVILSLFFIEIHGRLFEKLNTITGNMYHPFLDLLLELSKHGALTDREVTEELDAVIAAGFETTSNQLTYILLQLGAHPEVQEKVYHE